MHIRKITADDYLALQKLYKELDEFHVEARPDFFVHRDDVYPRDAFDANIQNPVCLQLGAFDEQDVLVAMVRATLWHESGMVKTLKTVCLDDIYVLPMHRRSGIATKLFEQVEAWAQEQGAVRLELHTWDFNRGAIAMYHAMGVAPQRYVFEKKL